MRFLFLHNPALSYILESVNDQLTENVILQGSEQCMCDILHFFFIIYELVQN